MTPARTPVVVAVLTALMLVATASAQAPAAQPVVLEPQSTARALDAVAAVFAVARNLEDAEIGVGIESVADGFADLADETAAQDQLTAALGAYGFEGYRPWADTIKTIFATYGYVQSAGPTDPLVEKALQQVMNDAGVPQSQKDAIYRHIAEMSGEPIASEVAAPTPENLAVVIGLAPHIASTIEMIRAMQ